MGLITILNGGKKRFTIVDVASDEIAMFALALLIAKYISVTTSLSWYWYVIIFIIFMIKPITTLFSEEDEK